MTHTLKAEARDANINLQKLRAQDMVPAVYYGQEKDATSISIHRQTLIRLFKEVGQTGVVELETPDGIKQALIHDIQLNPLTHRVIHVDFYTVDANQKVTVAIPLEFVGVAPAEKNGLGALTKALNVLEVESIPAKLPSSIQIDISGIETLDHNIYASDVVLPEGVELITAGDSVIVTVSAIREEEESVEMDLDSIESAEKGDPVEEGGEEAAK